MPFKIGQSGNPKGREPHPVGRPLANHDYRQFCRDVMERRAGGWDHLAMMATTPGKQQFAALQLIASYAYGRPTERIEAAGVLEVRHELSHDRLSALIERAATRSLPDRAA